MGGLWKAIFKREAHLWRKPIGDVGIDSDNVDLYHEGRNVPVSLASRQLKGGWGSTPSRAGGHWDPSRYMPSRGVIQVP